MINDLHDPTALLLSLVLKYFDRCVAKFYMGNLLKKIKFWPVLDIRTFSSENISLKDLKSCFSMLTTLNL